VHYLALGDSISIDEYTGVAGGGAASQLAHLIRADPFQDFTVDGWTTAHVLDSLSRVVGVPDVVTLTIGGNDLLASAAAHGRFPPDPATWVTDAEAILFRVEDILQRCDRLWGFHPIIVMNTVYDPTDGDDRYFEEMGMPAHARRGLTAFNDGVRRLARERKALLSDLEPLFHGHGFWSADPWVTEVIEPNLAGAAAIAKRWAALVAHA